jgi:hypothetical protein
LGSVLDVKGSWHLTLSSVEPYRAPDGGIPGYELFVTHGSLDATLVKIDTGAVGDAGVGASTVSLSLSF